MRREASRARAVEKLADALADIETYDPARYRRMRRDCRRIMIAICPRPFYFEEGNIVVIPADFVLERGAGGIACALVHEFTHAAMAARGIITGLVPQWIPRIERICVEEEIAFLERVPYERYPRKDEGIAQKRAVLQTEWWTPEAHREAWESWQAWCRERGI